MVGWLYIEGQVAAPVHVLDIDPGTGVMGVEVAGKFVPDRAALRGEVVVEYYGWKTRRLVRCLGAERIGTQLMIEAVDVGRASAAAHEDTDPRGPAEDWLVVEGKPVCQARGFTCGAGRQGAAIERESRTPQTSGGGGTSGGHCMMHVSREAWRDLRVGEHAPLAAVGVPGSTVASTALPTPGTSASGTITPLLHPTPLGQAPHPAEVKIVRLREREVIHITPLASDWSDDSTLVVARVERVESFASTSVGINTNA